MTASVSTNININDTATTQPSTNGQAGHTNESIKPLQPVLLQSAAEKTVPSPPGVNKASALSPRIQQTKEPSLQMPAMTGFRPTISALGTSQTLNSTSNPLSNGVAFSSTSPTAAAVTAVSGGADTPKKIKKAVRAADPQSLKRSSGDTGSDDKTVRKKRAANPLAMLDPDGFSMSPISGSMVETGSPHGSIKAAKGRGRGPSRLTPKPPMVIGATSTDGGNDQRRFQWPKTTDQHPTSAGARLFPMNPTPMPLLPTEGLPGNLNDLMIFMDRFQLKWQDERLELITYGLTDLDRIQLLLQVATSPYGHVSTIRDYLQSRCEPRLVDAGEALRPTLQNILDHLACAQKSRTSNAVRILLATTALLMETITLELDQIPISGLYMINESYFRPDEDWPAVGQRIHPSIISLKYLAGLWEDVLRRSEDCSYVLDLTLKEYERISEALAALREVWEVEGRVDLEEVGSMETRMDRVLRILGRKIRQLKAAQRRPRVINTEAFAATPIPAAAASTSHHPVPASASSTASAAPTSTSSPSIPTHIRAASLPQQVTSNLSSTPAPQQVTSPLSSTPAFSGAVKSTPVTGRTTPTLSSHKVVPTLASLWPVKNSSAPSSSSALPASPRLNGSTGASNGSNVQATSVTVYSMFPPYGLVNIGPTAPSTSIETATKTTQSTERSSSPSVSDVTMTESQQELQHREAAATAMSILTATTQIADNDPKELAFHLTGTNVLPTITRRPSAPAHIAPTEVKDPHANEVIILDDDPSMTTTAIAAPMTIPPMTKHRNEVDDHAEHQGDDPENEVEDKDREDSIVEPEDESNISVNSLTKGTVSMKEPVSLTGLKQHHGLKGTAESSASHTRERAISNASSEAYHDAFQAFTGSEDEEDQLVDEDYDDYDTQPKGAQHHGLRLSPHKAESYLARAQSPLRHESQVAAVLPSSQQSSVQSSTSTSGVATKQPKITALMQRRIDAAAAEAARNAEAARRRALIGRPPWISADDKDDREVTPGLSSAATSASTSTDRRSTTPARSTTPSSSSSRLSMGRKRSTSAPRDKPVKPELVPLPIKEALTPEEEALAIARVQMTKDGKVYKMDVKRKGAMIIPAHLYVAPKTLLTPKLTPEELEALAAKTSLEGSGSRGSGRRSTRGSGASEEPLLDLDMAQSIKRLKLKKETQLRKEREESALSSSSTTSKSTF